MYVGDRMSKTTLGQKSLGLTTRLLVGTGLVISLTQSLNEDGAAGKSLAMARQQSWTQQVFAGSQPSLSVEDKAYARFQPVADNLTTGSIVARFTGQSGMDDASGKHVQIAHIQKHGNETAVAEQMVSLDEIRSGLQVNRAAKKDRRLGWQWEPFHVAHGRRQIALNWSGSVWSMTGPFTEIPHEDLPKLAFEPEDDLEMVMADAQQFLPSDASGMSDIMVAQNDWSDQTVNPENVGSGQAALAYAPNSTEALEEPFKAILTEQRTGQISEDNQVTILGAVEKLNEQLDRKHDATANEQTEIASIDPITALPRARTTTAQKSRSAKVSKPMDISPIVANLEAKEQEQEQEAQQAKAESGKKIGLTMAKSQAVRAELKLASLSGDTKVKEKKKSRWASWFSFGGSKNTAKIDAKGEHAWVTNKLPKSSFTKKQKTCLANAIYFESRSEPEKGQIAVGQVVINRVKNPAYPNSICGVVYQNQHKRNACQFSFACDRIPDRVRSKKAWDLAWKLANEVVNGKVWLKSVGSATHYHATYVRPKWARTMQKRKKIGLHIFYRTYGGGWS